MGLGRKGEVVVVTAMVGAAGGVCIGGGMAGGGRMTGRDAEVWRSGRAFERGIPVADTATPEM